MRKYPRLLFLIANSGTGRDYDFGEKSANTVVLQNVRKLRVLVIILGDCMVSTNDGCRQDGRMSLVFKNRLRALEPEPWMTGKQGDMKRVCN